MIDKIPTNCALFSHLIKFKLLILYCPLEAWTTEPVDSMGFPLKPDGLGGMFVGSSLHFGPIQSRGH